MKLKVYDSKPKEETVFLKFIETIEGITVVVVDENGRRILQGNLLSISKEGIRLPVNVSEKFGFTLDTHGRLEIEKE